MSMNLAYQTYPPEAQVAKAMQTQYARDMSALRDRGIWPPPWVNEDFTIQQDEARLLTAIADYQDVYWHRSRPDVCKRVADFLGMLSPGNAKTTVQRCISLGYVRGVIDRDAGMIRLDLTPLGRDMLDLWEDDKSLNAGFEDD